MRNWTNVLVTEQEFAKAVRSYQRKLNGSAFVSKTLKLDEDMEKKRKVIVRSFSIARDMYSIRRGMLAGEESELQVGAKFLEVWQLEDHILLPSFC